jgi:hypothetical protein
MNNQNKAVRPDQTGGAEIERTPEMIKNGEPTIGTKHAGQEGADYIPAHTDDSEKNISDADASR